MRRFLNLVKFMLMTVGALTIVGGIGLVLWLNPLVAQGTTPLSLTELQLQIDPLELITIKDEAQIAQKRMDLTESLFKTQTLDLSRVPDEVEENVTDPIYASLSGIKQINHMITRMDFGIESRVSLLIPDQPREDLIVYGYGHNGVTEDDLGNIGYFIEHDYPVMAVAMPLVTPNNWPTVDTDYGRFVFTNHMLLNFVEPKVQRGETIQPRGSILYIFVEPILASLNLVAEDYDRVFMVGISGGGWTTVLYSALDTRIVRSYPVAGALPMYLKQTDPSSFALSSDMGDFEQWHLPLALGFDYLDLFVLGASDGRSQLQVYNLYDACCFGGTRASHYEEAVRSTIERVGGGEFRIYFTQSHNHEITTDALDEIRKDIEKDADGS